VPVLHLRYVSAFRDKSLRDGITYSDDVVAPRLGRLNNLLMGHGLSGVRTPAYVDFSHREFTSEFAFYIRPRSIPSSRVVASFSSNFPLATETESDTASLARYIRIIMLKRFIPGGGLISPSWVSCISRNFLL